MYHRRYHRTQCSTTSLHWSLDVGLASQQYKVELHMAHKRNEAAKRLFCCTPHTTCSSSLRNSVFVPVLHSKRTGSFLYGIGKRWPVVYLSLPLCVPTRACGSYPKRFCKVSARRTASFSPSNALQSVRFQRASASPAVQ
jgi:hypothetical protein